ncbi:hypothetical protein M2G59_21370 [Vibrio vulnificus]|uniref:hypothetical protein n=1 Tax=Vibrio TaxID=662 RepID=UPI00076B4581|nr:MULTISPECIES: hypothetical protein [Vibrio]ELF4909359.1 hypothetical protein [Vibrio vulnificus]ELF6258957.1 hypothetical protein [Vibrio vulnificus]ELG9630614.1 hypothetical protein [Vibrio vulnificus]ELH0867490.1 hypothetical protein [Vibrio vulnificus]ELH7846036.1 hypothetical protein [Vibrio vulnificus]
MKGDSLISAAWALWDTQESLLQNYRGIFISSESILLSLSVTVLSIGDPLFALLLAVPGLFLHRLWRSICTSRGRDVSFAQRLIEKIEMGDVLEMSVLCEFKRYQSEHNSKSGYVFGTWELNKDKVFAKMQLSKTRIKMDKHLPNAYAVLWVLVVLLSLYKYLF